MGNVGDDPKVNQINGDNSVFIDGKGGKSKRKKRIWYMCIPCLVLLYIILTYSYHELDSYIKS